MFILIQHLYLYSTHFACCFSLLLSHATFQQHPLSLLCRTLLIWDVRSCLGSGRNLSGWHFWQREHFLPIFSQYFTSTSQPVSLIHFSVCGIYYDARRSIVKRLHCCHDNYNVGGRPHCVLCCRLLPFCKTYRFVWTMMIGSSYPVFRADCIILDNNKRCIIPFCTLCQPDKFSSLPSVIGSIRLRRERRNWLTAALVNPSQSYPDIHNNICHVILSALRS